MVDLRARRRQEVRDEVRSVAIGLMAERGFDGVTVEEIAASTSVSPSTIYRHFGTKEALVLTPGRPERLVDVVGAGHERSDLAAIRSAVEQVYAGDSSVPGELRLVASNAGLAEQFRRELADQADALAASLARRDDREVDLADRARAAAILAAVTVSLLHWAGRSAAGLASSLDLALATLAPESTRPAARPLTAEQPKQAKQAEQAEQPKQVEESAEHAEPSKSPKQAERSKAAKKSKKKKAKKTKKTKTTSGKK